MNDLVPVREYTSINLGLSGRIERGIPCDGRRTVRGPGRVMLSKGISYEGSRTLMVVYCKPNVA